MTYLTQAQLDASQVIAGLVTARISLSNKGELKNVTLNTIVEFISHWPSYDQRELIQVLRLLTERLETK